MVELNGRVRLVFDNKRFYDFDSKAARAIARGLLQAAAHVAKKEETGDL